MADLSSSSVPQSPRGTDAADTDDGNSLNDDVLDGENSNDSSALGHTQRQSPPRDRTHGALSVFDGDDIAIDVVAELIDDAVVCSLEAFYERKLLKYAATWLGDRVFDALRAVSFTPHPRCDLPSESVESASDPVMAVVCPAHRERVLHEPQPCAVDPFSRHGIELRAPEPPSQSHLAHTSATTSRAHGTGHAGKDSPSRPSSHASFRMRKTGPSLASSASPPVSPRSAGVAAHSGFGPLHDTNLAGQGHQHAPGVVYSTAPPPRISPRKAMLLLKNAQRVSTVGGPSAPGKRESGEKTASGDDNRSEDSSTDPGESGAKCDGSGNVAQSTGVRRRRVSADNDVAAWSPDDASGDREHHEDDDEQSGEENATTSLFDSKPIQVEFAIKRGGHQHGHRPQHCHSDPSGANHSSSSVLLPELSPQRRLSRSATPPVTSATGLNGSRASLERIPHTDADERSDDCYVDDAGSLHSHLQTMVLAPGVKLQCDEGTKTGPELPLFPTRMRKATFYQDDALALTLAASLQSLHSSASHSSKSLHRPPSRSHHPHQHGNVFLTECSEASPSASTAWSDREEQSSSAELLGDHQLPRRTASARGGSPTASSASSWTSTAASMFKRASKVQRPCTTGGGTGACHGTCTGPAACPGAVLSPPSSAAARTSLAPNSATTGFKDLAKQRAFMRKTSLAPSSPKKMSLCEKERERRPAAAASRPPLSSPLARRSLHVKRGVDPLAQATKIL